MRLLLILFLSSCTQNKTKTIDMGNYKIEVPENWKETSVNGFDTYVRIIVTANGDTITSDFGNHSERFNETNKIFSKKQLLKYKDMGMDTEKLFWSTTPEIDQAQGSFLKEFYMYDTINKYNAKFRIPKRAGHGITGVFIDSIYKTNNSLTITAKNLDKDESDLLVNSFYTIEFNKH